MKGLEPSTFCMASRRSSQLSYIRVRPEYSDRGRRVAGAPVRRGVYSSAMLAIAWRPSRVKDLASAIVGLLLLGLLAFGAVSLVRLMLRPFKGRAAAGPRSPRGGGPPARRRGNARRGATKRGVPSRRSSGTARERSPQLLAERDVRAARSKHLRRETWRPRFSSASRATAIAGCRASPSPSSPTVATCRRTGRPTPSAASSRAAYDQAGLLTPHALALTGRGDRAGARAPRATSTRSTSPS